MARFTALLLILTQGCVSFTYSRFTPDSASRDEACSDKPPLADFLLGLGLGVGAMTVNSLNVAYACSDSTDPRCRSENTHAALYIPALIAAASTTYGVAAYVVCKQRSSGDPRSHP
jgi:hypothetical protein